MAQITSGIHAILSHPFVYSAFQTLMGAHQARTRFAKDFIKSTPGMKILDIGCGPADILNHIPSADYYGFDISELYIAQARSKYGNHGTFYCQYLAEVDLEALPAFDIVLALGLIHHLDDAQAINVMQLAYKSLKPGGRLLTVDPCLDPSQNPIARFLIQHDRGQNVRNKAGYESIANQVFDSPRLEVRHQTWIPYTHCFMECTK